MGLPYFRAISPPNSNFFIHIKKSLSDHSWSKANDPQIRYVPLYQINETMPRYLPILDVTESSNKHHDIMPPPPVVNITSDVLREMVSNSTCPSEETVCLLAGNDTFPLVLDEEFDLDSRNWLFLLLIVLVVAGGLGNVLVCLAICLERRLQNVTNYFLLSLAVADLLVCVAVMPFGIVDGFLGYWPFDWHVCSVWVSCDVLSCSSSIMHMCFISLGRYLGIRNPLKTRASSKKMVMIKIVLVWLLSMAITSPITVLAMIDATNVEPAPGICAINNRFFFIFGSMFAFYVPMVVMIVTYVLTVRLLQRKAKFLAEKPTRRVPFIRRARRSSQSSPESSSKNGHFQSSPYCSRCQTEVNASSDKKNLIHLTAKDPRNDFKRSIRPRSRYAQEHQHHHHHQQSFKHHQQLVPGMVRTLGTNQVMNEQKATKVLGIVFFSFVICWTPFFLLNVLFALKSPEDFPSYLTTTFLWLGYVSSTINPIIYTVFNKNFKRAFWKLLTCQCHFIRHASLHSTNDLTSWAFRSATNYTPKPESPPDAYQESLC